MSSDSRFSDNEKPVDPVNKLMCLNSNNNKSLPAGRDERIHPMFAFQKEVNHLFDSFFQESNLGGLLGPGLGLGLNSSAFFERNWDPLTPKMDIAEFEDRLVVTAEMPGLTENDFDVTIQGNLLSIKGEKKQESEDREKGWYRVERHFGSFSRSIPLPYEVDQESIAAQYKNGVLTVTLPKLSVPEASAKRIDVKGPKTN